MDNWIPTHKHFKGELYRIIMEAKHSETLEIMVIYENHKGEVWARPKVSFYGKLKDGSDRFSLA